MLGGGVRLPSLTSAVVVEVSCFRGFFLLLFLNILVHTNQTQELSQLH